ncbi:HupE/UreJ family protein [Aquabacterium sp.]|uniref:HupE/UreJ family protein n=1 Tax=Aquabacterium sp. TaxID=1872578 RepID=UPI00248710AA|nr:HupE/UreJ family protein [Aquabacterium sp.]MDI1261281.1 HupE/UreJ family protein [Aquabacterium sp.]
MKNFKLKLLLLALALLLLGGLAQAHKPSDSYLTLTPQDAGRVDVSWHIALRDLDTELGLDRDDDGLLTWGEVRPRWSELMNFARPTLRLRHDGQDCTPMAEPPAEPQIDTHTDGRYAVLRWTAQCPLATGHAWQSLDIDYRLFALTDPTHRGIVRLTASLGDTRAVVLGTPRPTQTLTFHGSSPPSFWPSLWRFILDGMHHIAIGTDHILFLMSLLLVSVWQRPGPARWYPPMAGWQPRPSWGGSATEVLRLVTAFTVAHSITLGLAAFGVLSPPSRWVESLIALSVLLAALDNMLPLLRAPRWTVVFGFGLVHGFGFAGAMQDLGLSGGDLAVPLLGFNLGVELGQLALVAVTLPIIGLLRRTPLYRWVFVGGGSLLIAFMATVWLIERVFDTTLPVGIPGF